jgi:hypothetical protein
VELSAPGRAFQLNINPNNRLAFGSIIGAGAQTFMVDLYENQCFNKPGLEMVATTGQVLISLIVTAIISALLSLILAPMSAFYGGRLVGVPYTKEESSVPAWGGASFSKIKLTLRAMVFFVFLAFDLWLLVMFIT